MEGRGSESRPKRGRGSQQGPRAVPWVWAELGGTKEPVSDAWSPSCTHPRPHPHSPPRPHSLLRAPSTPWTAASTDCHPGPHWRRGWRSSQRFEKYHLTPGAGKYGKMGQFHREPVWCGLQHQNVLKDRFQWLQRIKEENTWRHVNRT